MNVEAATLLGGQRNQDVFALFDNTAVVMDGASSYPATDPTRDGGRYARTLLAAIGLRLRDGGPLAECLADAIRTMQDSDAARPGGASSTVLMARANIETVDVLVLGDSTLIVEQSGADLEVLTDGRMAAVATEQRAAYRSALAAGHGYDTEHRQRLASLQDAERAARNRPGGYWIAESDPQAAHHAYTRTFRRERVTGLLLMTDGAAAAVTRYSRPSSWNALLAQFDHHGTAATLTDINTHEQADPDGQQWPRSKRHDDKTALRVRLPHSTQQTRHPITSGCLR